MSSWQLVALLREVKYLKQQDAADRDVPESAASVFEQNETYRKYLQNLDVVVTLYNQVRDTILDVEYPLIEQQLQNIDEEIEKAVAKLNWTSEGKFNVHTIVVIKINKLKFIVKCLATVFSPVWIESLCDRNWEKGPFRTKMKFLLWSRMI